MVATKKPSTNGRGTTLPGKPSEPTPVTIQIPKLNILSIRLKVLGITPLIQCRFDEKVKQAMADKTEGKAANKKSPKDPEAEWNAARWISTEGWDGIHAGGLRAAIIDAARSVDGLTMTELKQAVFVKADGRSKDGSPLVRIYGPKPEKFSNMCRTTTGVAYPRHRPMYKVGDEWNEGWGMILQLELNAHILSQEAAVNLVSLAGFTCGVGEWRPTSPKSKTGDNGRFKIIGDE